MAKTISQIREEINNFYLSIQNEITDVSTGSVAGGLIYAVSAALRELYQDIDEIETQAYIATASGNYLDLLINGGFFLERPGATRSTGYVLVYADEQIADPASVGSALICADYDYSTGSFTSGLEESTKFTGVNTSGTSTVTYSLIKPVNSAYYVIDSNGRITIDLKGKQAQYLVLPVASVLSGRRVNVREGKLNVFSNPPDGLRYVRNVNNPGEVIFNSSGISTAPLYSRLTTMNSLSGNTFSVVNAFNFSSSGFLEILYKADSPTKIIKSIYRNESGEEASGGIVFNYSNKTQSSITLSSSNSYIQKYSNNIFSTYNLAEFTYEGITYSVDSSDAWTASSLISLPDGSNIGPSTAVSGSANFFSRFFFTNPWTLQQRREQVSADIIFDPDSALTETTYLIKEGSRLSTAADEYSDTQYRNYFKTYINSLPRGTNSALEFAALQVPGISFAKTLPAQDAPAGSAVILASSENGQLSPDLRQDVINYLEDDWVSAGVNLIVSAPDLVEFVLSVSVTLVNESFVNSVRSNITNSISSYLSSLNPNDEIKYGDVYSIIASISGVKNVSKLVIGKHDPDHYLDYRQNYAVLAVDKAVGYNTSTYTQSSEIVFPSTENEVVLSSDLNNGNSVSPITFSNFSNYLTSEKIFSEFNANNTVYGSVNGLFSSDGGQQIITSDYSVSLYSSLESPLTENNKVIVSFNVDTSDQFVSITANSSVVVVSSDIGLFRTVEFSAPEGSTSVTLEFSANSISTVSGIQSFLHDSSFDSYLVGDINGLQSLSIIDNTRIGIVKDLLSNSSKFKTLSVIRSVSDDNENMESLVRSIIDSDNISAFRSVLRDYQYGTNFSGRNSGNIKDFFADTSQNDAKFKHFFTYVTTAPLSSSLASFYPLDPSLASNDKIADYTLTSREISRLHNALINPNLSIVPATGILIS